MLAPSKSNLYQEHRMSKLRMKRSRKANQDALGSLSINRKIKMNSSKWKFNSNSNLQLLNLIQRAKS